MDNLTASNAISALALPFHRDDTEHIPFFNHLNKYTHGSWAALVSAMSGSVLL